MIVIKKERYIYYVSEINGNSFCSYLGNDTEEFRKKIEVAFHFKDPLLHENHDYRNKHICLNISNACNLKCSYCFRYKNESTKPIDFDRACKFIESQIDDNFDRFMVDMTGSGEPLLQLKTIIKLADFCTSLSKKIAKENSNIIEISISPKLTIYQGFEYHLEYCFLNSENDPLKNIQFHTFDPTRFAGNKIKDYLNYGEIVAPYSYGKLHLGTDLTLITDLLGFSLPSGGTTPSHC